MKIAVMQLGAYQTNCYMVWAEDSDKCVLIDPGYQPEEILEQIRSKGKTLEAILLTHGHFDHVGGVESLVRETGCQLWLQEGDYTQFQSPENDYFYPIHDCKFTQVNLCKEGQQIQAGGLVFTVMETPGHTWGSVCYICQDFIFSGDTLFEGSCGRTDLPGGDWETLMGSLHRLAQLQGDYRVLPGHGPSSTLSEEKRSNPFMR